MLSLCAFNEGLPRSRAARTKEHDRRPRLFFPLCPKPLSYKKQKGGPGNSRLRASDEHVLIVHVPRGEYPPYFLLLSPLLKAK